jgi:hypothetical protein
MVAAKVRSARKCSRDLSMEQGENIGHLLIARIVAQQQADSKSLKAF